MYKRGTICILFVAVFSLPFLQKGTMMLLGQTLFFLVILATAKASAGNYKLKYKIYLFLPFKEI